MKLFFILLLFIAFQDEVPFKSSDEFQVTIDLKFKTKDSAYGPSTYNQNGERIDKVSATPLPFLSISVGQIKIQNDEIKVIAVDTQGKTLQKKTLSPDLALNFDMGFVDDLKSRKANHEIVIYFLSGEKKKLRKIVVSVAPTGVFEVNGKWNGQF